MLEKIKEITAESLGADAGTITEQILWICLKW